MAKKTTKLAIRVTDKEQIWGLFYLLFTFLLPTLLGLLNGLLASPLQDAWFNFLYFALNFIFIIWIFHDFFKRCLVHIGQHFWLFLLVILVGTVVYWLCNWGLSFLFSILFPRFSNLNDGSIIAMAHDNFLIMFIGTVVFVPVAEEALHRGLVFGSLYTKSHFAAYILSAAIFSAVHIIHYIGAYSLPHVLLAFVQYLPAGLILAWAYRKSGSIFASILIHAVVNAIALILTR